MSPLRILPPVGFIRAPNGIFRTVLALDQPAENTVDVTCSLETLPPGSDISNTTEVCSSPPADTVMFANSSVKLKLTAKEIQFEVRPQHPLFLSFSYVAFFSHGCEEDYLRNEVIPSETC